VWLVQSLPVQFDHNWACNPVASDPAGAFAYGKTDAHPKTPAPAAASKTPKQQEHGPADTRVTSQDRGPKKKPPAPRPGRGRGRSG
jgi:hypothetical protein